MEILEHVLKIKTVSESNSSSHWAEKYRRHKKQKIAIQCFFICVEPKIELPCHIKLTRLGKKKMDDDNLVGAFKWIRDAIADRMIPGLAPGRADGDPRLTWEYDQKITKEGYQIMITFSF